MKYTDEQISVSSEVLARHLGGELIVPFDFSEGFKWMKLDEAQIFRAGSPIFMCHAVEADYPAVAETGEEQSQAIGILLNDVTPDNPNGALVKAFAAVNVANFGKVVEHWYDSLKTALPNIVFEGVVFQHYTPS